MYRFEREKIEEREREREREEREREREREYWAVKSRGYAMTLGERACVLTYHICLIRMARISKRGMQG